MDRYVYNSGGQYQKKTNQRRGRKSKRQTGKSEEKRSQPTAVPFQTKFHLLLLPSPDRISNSGDIGDVRPVLSATPSATNSNTCIVHSCSSCVINQCRLLQLQTDRCEQFKRTIGSIVMLLFTTSIIIHTYITQIPRRTPSIVFSDPHREANT